MSPFNPKSWFKRRSSQNSLEVTDKEDQQQTFILEPIYTPSGFTDVGDDPDAGDLSPIDDPMDDLSTNEGSDVPGDDGDNIGDDGENIEGDAEDIIPEGDKDVGDVDNEYIPDNEIGETIPYAEDEENPTQTQDSGEDGEASLGGDVDGDGETNDGELTDDESPDSEENPEGDDINHDVNDVENELEDNPEGNDINNDQAENELEDNPEGDDTENQAENDNSDEIDEENADVDNSEEGDSETDSEAEDDLEDDDDNPLAFDVPEFNSGIFQVGNSGEVGVDFLFDGGRYQGEVAFFSLAGFDELEFNSIEDFIAEAAQRAASGSEQGHIVIRVADEGARFTGSLFGEPDWNTGVYQGVKTFNMTPGDEFGVMLVPNGRVSEVLDNPSIGGAKRPLFSLAPSNPQEGFHLGQIADLTGDGNTFVFEDQRVEVSDWDYDDVIFQIRGAVGDAVHVETVIDPDLDWREDNLGKALLAYSKPYLATSEQLDLAELVAEDPDGLLGGDDGMSPPDSGNPDLDGEDLDDGDADLDEVEETDALEEADDSDSQESQTDSDSADEDEAVESSGESGSTSGDSSSNPDSSSSSGGNETVSETQPSTEESEMTSGVSSETVTGEEASEGSESLDEVSEAQQEPVSEEPVSDNPVGENEVDDSSEETAPSQETDPLVTAAKGFEFAKEDQPLVGIIDTGFAENNPDLNYDNFILGRDWVDGDDNPLLAPGEGSEHGTHLLGLIAAQQDNGIGIDGINPEAPVWLGRGVGSGEWASSLVEFVDAAAESGQANAVVNLSLDLTEIDTEGNVSPRYELTVAERTAIEYARQQGVLLVVAAGNDGSNLSGLAQASREFDNVLTVGAAEAFDPNLAVAQGHGRAEYSNFGTGLGLLAPGGTAENPVLSTVGDDLGTLAGTSVATARVTGATSLVWAANPELSYRQVIEILQTTATDLGTPNWNPDTGAGLLNLLAAVHLAKATQPQAYDPTPIEIGETPRRRHLVRPGETPAGLAERELGDEEAWVEITDAEGNPFESPDEPLVPGTEVELPMYGGGVVNPQVESPAREPQPLTPANQAPEDLQVSLNRLYNPGETIRLSGWVSDADGAEDLERVEFWLRQDSGDWVEIGETREFAIDPNHPDWGGFEQELSGLTPGQYELRVIPADQDGQLGEAVTQTFTVLSVPEEQHLSERVKRAITQAMKLEAYHPDILALTEQWVVSVKQGESPEALAQQLGGTVLEPTGHIPNTYVWKFDGDSDPYEIAAAMERVREIEFAYPLVNFSIEFYSTPWHLENTGQTGGQPGVDARVKLAWQDHGVSGKGATIGFLDSGFDYEHPNLSANYQAHLSYDFDEDNSYPSYTFSTQVISPNLIAVARNGGSETINIDWDERLSHRVFKGYLSNLALTLPGIDVEDEASLEDIEISLISPWETEFKLTDLESGSKSYFTDVFNGENPNDLHREISDNNVWRLLIDNNSSEPIIIHPNWSIDFDLVDAHGTQVAGAAIANSETGTMGVAPGANWAGLRMGSDFINDGSLAKALSHENQSIDIYNNSWGVSFRQHILPQTLYGLEAGSQNGRNNLGNLFVFAAGNEGHNGDDVNYNPLANSRHAIAVGAVDQSGRNAVYSNPGAPLLLSAPSENSSYLSSTDIPISIPGDGSTLSLELGTVEGVSDLINRVEVHLGIEHEKYEDLDVSLVQVTPEGEERRVQLLADVPFTIENYLAQKVRDLSIRLADNAARDLPDDTASFHGRFRPQESLDIFKGQDVNGTWKIEIKDRHTQNLSGSVRQAAVTLSTTGIATTDIQGEAGTTSGNFTNEFGGTSAAAPIVSGVIALMLEVNPQLSWRDIQHILVETANREAIQDADADWSGSPGDSIRHSHQYGFGMVDAEAAVAAAKTWKPVGPEVSVEITGNLAHSDRFIPDNDPEGVSSSVTVDEEFTVEWVEVDFRSSHDEPDHLRLELVHTYTTEDGEEKTTVSTLARPYQSSGQNYYNDWWFSSVRHWGEPAEGTWTLRVSDETYSENKTIGGIWDDWSLILHGSKPDPKFDEFDFIVLDSPNNKIESEIDSSQLDKYYQFTLEEPGYFRVGVSGGDPGKHPSLSVINSDGSSAFHNFDLTPRYWNGGVLGVAFINGFANNSVNRTGFLESGTYYIKLDGSNLDNLEYSLSTNFVPDFIPDNDKIIRITQAMHPSMPFSGTEVINTDELNFNISREITDPYSGGWSDYWHKYILEVIEPKELELIFEIVDPTETDRSYSMIYPRIAKFIGDSTDDKSIRQTLWQYLQESGKDAKFSSVANGLGGSTTFNLWTDDIKDGKKIIRTHLDLLPGRYSIEVETWEAWQPDLLLDYNLSFNFQDGSVQTVDGEFDDSEFADDQQFTLNTSVFKVGDEFQVNTYNEDDQWLPSATGLSDGGFVVTWESDGQDGSGYGIYGQRYDSNGNAVGPEFQVNTHTDNNQRRPSITGLSDGGFVATWTSHINISGSIYGQRYDNNGNPVGSEFQVNTYSGSQRLPSVTDLSDGGFVVTWESWHQDGSGSGIYGQRYDNNGSAIGSEFQINTYTDGNQSAPSVTGLFDGGFIVTWTSDDQDGSGRAVFGQRYDSNGNAVGSEFQINTYTDGWQVGPSITGLSDGGFVVTWESDGQDRPMRNVYGQRYDSIGNAVGSEFQINTYTDGWQVGSSVTGLSDGGFVVTWESDGQGGWRGVFGQRYDSNGNAVGSEFQVNTYTEKDQTFSSVTELANGQFVVTWMSDGQDGSGYGVFGQIFGTEEIAPNTPPTTPSNLNSEITEDTATLSWDAATDEETPQSDLTYNLRVGTTPGGSDIIDDTRQGEVIGNVAGNTNWTLEDLEPGTYYWSVQTVDSGFETSDFASEQSFTIEPSATIEEPVFKIGDEFQVNTYTYEDQWGPSVTQLADGGFVVTWQSWGQPNDDSERIDGYHPNANWGIYGQRYDGDGNPVGSEFQINTSTQGAQENPSVTELSNSGFVVTWQSNDPENPGIYGQRYDSDGNPVGSEFQVHTSTQGGQENPSVAQLADGGFVVTWQSSDQDSSGIYGQRYDSDGNPVASEFQVNTSTENTLREPSVTQLGDGGFVVTWTDGSNISGQRYDGDGNLVASEFQVNTSTEDIRREPSVTQLGDGGFVVTWTDGSNISGQRYDSDGNPVGSEFQVNTSTETEKQQLFSSVTQLENGGFVVTWNSQDVSSGTLNVHAQRYDADGKPIGSEFQVNTYSDGVQAMSSIADLGDGKFIVTWMSEGQDGSYMSIFGQIFGTDGTVENPTNLTEIYFTEDLHTEGNEVRMEDYPKANQARTEFLANLVNLQTVDFEEFENHSRPQVLNFGETTATLSYTGDLMVETLLEGTNGGMFPTSGKNYLMSRDDTEFTIEFSEPQSAFGMNITDAEGSPFSMTLHREDGTTKNIVIPIEADYINFSGSVVFLGVKDAETPFNAVTIHKPEKTERIGLDELVIGDIKP